MSTEPQSDKPTEENTGTASESNGNKKSGVSVGFKKRKGNAVPRERTLADDININKQDTNTDTPVADKNANSSLNEEDKEKEDKNNDNEDNPSEDSNYNVYRPAKKKKEGIISNSTASTDSNSTLNKLKSLAATSGVDLRTTIASSKSAISDSSSNEHRHTVDVTREDKPKPKAGKPSWSGPQKASAANVRNISQMDYNPSICKDYHDTGYCGFGDSCKFLHDRGDYKSGWQLDREWDKKQLELQKIKYDANGDIVTESNEENYEIQKELPFACLICKKEFINPVVTKCGHYFCEACAINHHVKDTKCAVCRQQTYGIFNTAIEIIQALNKKKQRLKNAMTDEETQQEPQNANENENEPEPDSPDPSEDQ